MTNYLKEWATLNDVLKKIFFLYRNLLLQINPLNSSCSQKPQYPKRKLSPNRVLRKSSTFEKVAVPKVTLASANVYDYPIKIFTISVKH